MPNYHAYRFRNDHRHGGHHHDRHHHDSPPIPYPIYPPIYPFQPVFPLLPFLPFGRGKGRGRR